MTARTLTQATFAKRLTVAMDRLGISAVELERRVSIHNTTISRYRSPSYENGPPRLGKRRLLAQGLGIDAGYFDGSVRVNLSAVKRQQEVERWSTEGEPGKAPTLAQVRQRYRDAMLELSTGADARGMIRLTLAVETLSKLYAEILGAKEEK